MADFFADDDDEAFDFIDKLVEEHNAKKEATQRQTQAPSPVVGHDVLPNGAPQQAQPPIGGRGPAPPPAPQQQRQAPPAAAARPQPGAFALQQQQQQQQPQPLVGAISLAAAQLRAQGGLAAHGHQPPADPVQLQQRLGELEGTNKILRTNVDALERERTALRQRVAALESRSGGAAQAASMAEMQRQLDQLKQQLMFKEQELADAKRRAAAPRPAPPPQQAQQQQWEGAEAGEVEQPRAKRRANGTAAPVAAPQQAQQRPLFADPAALGADDAGSAAPAAAISRLWAACPAEMGCLLGGSGPTAAAEAEDAELARLRAQWAADLPRAASGLLLPAVLLPTLAAYVARACEASGGDGGTSPAVAAAQHSLEVAGAALTAMQHLVNEDPACQRLALASCRAPPGPTGSGVSAAVPSARLKLKNPVVLGAAVGSGDAALQPLQAQLSRLSVSVGPGASVSPPSQAPGLLGLCIAAARAASGAPVALRAGATGLALSLAVAAPLGPSRAALLPLLTSGAVLEFLRAPAPARAPAVLLLIALLQDPTVAAALDAAAAAAALPGAAGNAPGDGNGEGQGQAQGADTPRTRAAAAAAAAAAAGGGDGGDGGGGGEQGSGGKDPKNWAVDLIEAVMGCLRLVPGDGEDETALARAALGTLAVLLERKGAACFKLAMPGDDGQPKRPSSAGPTSAPKGSGNGAPGCSGSGSGGSADGIATASEPHGRAAGSLPVLLVLLAEEAVKYRGGADEAVAVLRPAAWPAGRSPAAAAAQAAWQRRLRLAQEALTLLRAFVADPVLASAALEELVGGPPAEVQRAVSAVGRLARLEPPAEAVAAQALLGALPVAPWAFAIGSSSGAASLAPLAAADRRAGLPVASAEDVAYMARGIKHRIVYRLRS